MTYYSPLRGPHWVHLMRLILEMGSKDVHQALGYGLGVWPCAWLS